jgi:hypothetical protein
MTAGSSFKMSTTMYRTYYHTMTKAQKTKDLRDVQCEEMKTQYCAQLFGKCFRLWPAAVEILSALIRELDPSEHEREVGTLLNQGALSISRTRFRKMSINKQGPQTAINKSQHRKWGKKRKKKSEGNK